MPYTRTPDNQSDSKTNELNSGVNRLALVVFGPEPISGHESRNSLPSQNETEDNGNPNSYRRDTLLLLLSTCNVFLFGTLLFHRPLNSSLHTGISSW